MKISVIINTYNASKHLKQVLEAVKGFDEIVICDMESTDNTIEIAKTFNCKIVTFKKGNHNIVEPARNFAIQQASHPWVLVVDADEVVPEQLKEYLYKRNSKPRLPCRYLHSTQELFYGQVHALSLSGSYFKVFQKRRNCMAPHNPCVPYSRRNIVFDSCQT